MYHKMNLLVYVVVQSVLLLNGGQSHNFERQTVNKSELTTVEYCVLIANPASYDGKEIRLTGTYVVIGNSDSYFFSSSCEGKMLWVEFTTGYESRSDVKALRALAEMRKKSGFRWVRPHVSVITGVSAKAEVRLVGRFRASNPYAQEVKDMGSLGQFTTPRARYDFVLEVLSAEKVRRLTN